MLSKLPSLVEDRDAAIRANKPTWLRLIGDSLKPCRKDKPSQAEIKLLVYRTNLLSLCGEVVQHI